MTFKDLCNIVTIKYLNDDVRPSGNDWLKMAFMELDPKIKSLESSNAKLRKLASSFLRHYDSRKITNGYHDLLAVKFRTALKETGENNGSK